VEVPALCEIVDTRLQQAAKWVTDSGRPAARLYGKGPKDFERLCAEEQLDCVICSTSWEWHAPVCLAANRNGKHAVTEVPCVLTLEQAWALVESFEKTGKWSTLGLEQALLEGNGYMALHNMVHQGVLGDMVHGESGYVHDLRRVKFPGGSEAWRLEHYIKRNGNLYPDHPMNKLMPMMDINHGDRFDYLISTSSRSGTLNEYAIATLGKDHPLATTKYAQGDFNVTLLHTEGGKMITLNHDTNTPHPRELYRLQGTKGVFYESMREMKDDHRWMYLDGITPTAHEWEPAAPYLKEYEHPLIKGYNPAPRKAIRGHGSGSKTPITWHLLVKNLRENKVPYFDVYDSVTSSVITGLTEGSAGNRSRPVEFPDFTKGKWKTRGPIQFG
jgi:predicted dehydrogenase